MDNNWWEFQKETVKWSIPLAQFLVTLTAAIIALRGLKSWRQQKEVDFQLKAASDLIRTTSQFVQVCKQILLQDIIEIRGKYGGAPEQRVERQKLVKQDLDRLARTIHAAYSEYETCYSIANLVWPTQLATVHDEISKLNQAIPFEFFQEHWFQCCLENNNPLTEADHTLHQTRVFSLYSFEKSTTFVRLDALTSSLTSTASNLMPIFKKGSFLSRASKFMTHLLSFD